MGYRTILVQCDAGKGTTLRARLAIDLAGRFGANVVGVYIRPRFEAPIFSDGSLAMSDLFRDYETNVNADEAAAAFLFDSACCGKTISKEWRVAEGFADEVLAGLAHTADLVIVGQAEPEPTTMGTVPDIAERLVLASERPILVLPYIGLATPPGKIVLLCWNGKREAGRAASAALPLLQKAEQVIVLTIDPPKPGESRAGSDPVDWLTRHGVKASLQHDTATEADVGTVILSRAADMSADLIVMGVYGHSRLREMVMGGASRTMLASMTVPLLIAH